MTLQERIYRRLLRSYAWETREAYGDEMLQLFRDQLRDARAAGTVPRFWLHILADWARSAVQRPEPPLHRTLLLAALLIPNFTLFVLVATGLILDRFIHPPSAARN